MSDGISITQTAHSLVYGDREKQYGSAKADMERFAALVSVVLGVPVTSRQCCLIMICLKLSRLIHDPEHQDSLIDIAGYAEVLNRVNLETTAVEDRPVDHVDLTPQEQEMLTMMDPRQFNLYLANRKAGDETT